MSVQGNLKAVRSLAEPLQVAMDNGARRALIPIENQRLHYYLPGWEVPKMRTEHFTDHDGFVVDYLAEAMRELRKHNFTEVLDRHFSLGSHLNSRDKKAVRKTVSGLMKILHPHGSLSRDDRAELVEFAIEGRRRVTNLTLPSVRKGQPHGVGSAAPGDVELVREGVRVVEGLEIGVPAVDLVPGTFEVGVSQLQLERHVTSGQGYWPWW